MGREKKSYLMHKDTPCSIASVAFPSFHSFHSSKALSCSIAEGFFPFPALFLAYEVEKKKKKKRKKKHKD
jgi:hypothetical protein